MRRDRRDVAARDRPGERGVAEAQDVVERGAEQRRGQPARFGHAGARSSDSASFTSVTRWFDAIVSDAW